MIDKALFWELMLNGISPTELLVYTLLMLLGAFVSFYMDVNRSIKHDRTTPIKFNLTFAIRDNLARFFMVLIAIYLNIVFFEQLTGSPISPYNALLLGLAFDTIIGRGTGHAKGLGAIKRNRDKLIKKYS